MSRKAVNYEYRKEVISYIINVAIILVFVMILLDRDSNLVLFPIAFLLCMVNSISSIVLTLISRTRNYGTVKGSKNINIIKYTSILVACLVLFIISVIVLW